jgi:peptidyl-prolyl cis-trans isomerase D
MMKFLRSQSQTVLVVVLGVIGLGFLFYGSAGNLITSSNDRGGSNDYGRINGEDLSAAELNAAVRNTRGSLILQGHRDDLTQPGAAAQIAELAWAQLLLLREADRLHITVSNQELVDYIHGWALFQKDGVYSPDVYRSRLPEIATLLRVQPEPGVDPLTSAETVFENILRDNLRADAVKTALLSTVRTSARDVSSQYEKYYGPVTVSMVTIDPKSLLASTQVSPAEIEAEYKAHPENPAYRTPEERKVDYVLFLLSPEQMKLSDQQKAAAKDALGQKALDFALAFQPDPSATSETAAPVPDFQAEARKEGLTTATTDFFAANAAPAGVPPSSGFNSAAFSLTKDNSISKVVELDNGVAVLHLDEIKPSELRPLKEVQGDIAKQLLQTDALQASRVSAQVTAAVLKSAMATGTDFKTAAASMKLKVETLPAFVPIKAAQDDQRLQTIAYSTLALKPGDVSDPVPMTTDNTTLILHLDSRGKADPAGLAAFETRFRDSQDQQLRAIVFADWADWKSKQPGTRKPANLDAFGSVE